MKRTKHLDDLSRFVIEQLAVNGGFSHEFIASMAFRVHIESVTPNQKAAVAGFLSRQRLSVKSWRRGMTVAARSFAKQHTARKRQRAMAG
jgi:hypothetical protein